MSSKHMSSNTRSWLILHGIFFFPIGFIAMFSVKGMHVGAYVYKLFSGNHLLIDVGLGVLAALISIIVLQPVIRLAGEKPARQIEEWMREIGPRQGYSIMASTSIGEEWIFRGAAQGLLTTWIGIVPAIVITSLIFTLLHIQVYKGAPVQLAISAILSVILGVLFYITRSLYAPIVFHAVYNVLEVWINRKKIFSYSIA